MLSRKLTPFSAVITVGTETPDSVCTCSSYGAEGDGPSIYFSDPDGNRIELKGPAIG